MTWSQALTAYLKRHKIKASELALVLDVHQSRVHYWTKGSEPRGTDGLEIKRRVEAWSRGEVPAAPWTAPKAPESGPDVNDSVRAAS